jgi:hypothetical protein
MSKTAQMVVSADAMLLLSANPPERSTNTGSMRRAGTLNNIRSEEQGNVRK